MVTKQLGKGYHFANPWENVVIPPTHQSQIKKQAMPKKCLNKREIFIPNFCRDNKLTIVLGTQVLELKMLVYSQRRGGQLSPTTPNFIL